MPLSPSLLAQEQAIFAQQERRRRALILKTLLPLATLGALGSVAYDIVVIAVTNVAGQPYVWFNLTSTVLYALLISAGTILLLWGHITTATYVTLSSSIVGVFFLVVARGIDRGIDLVTLAQFTLFAIVLLLAGALGNMLMVLVTALGMTVATCILFVVGHPTPGMAVSWQHQQWTVFTVALLVEWFTALLVAAQRYTYRHGMRDLGVAVERAKQLEELKDQFITNVNHELRTPIMTVNGSIDYLLQAHDTLSPAAQVRVLTRAKRNGKALTQLLASILDVRSIETGRVVSPQAVNVREVITTATDLVEPADAQQELRELHLNVAPDIVILGEAVRLQQIMTNLLSNATKYSPPGSPITIDVLYDEHAKHMKANERKPMVAIRVRDFGQGIPPDQIPLLFHRFVRLQRDLASNVPGNGLGLYLCRVFAEAMGGTITAESSGRPNEGTTFILQLPAA